MPTATTSPKTTRSSASRARKPARRKAAGASTSSRKTTTTRKASTPSARRRSRATRASASRTRALHQSERAAYQVQTASRDTAQVVGDYAERAVLIPVGAALIARDRIASTVTEAISNYSSPTRTQAQLRRFERRGVTARKRLEREVRKARVRVERQLRQRRRAIGSTFSDIDDRRETIAKNGSDLAKGVQERILSLV